MFVVATLMAGIEVRRVSRGAPVYFTPIVFHLAVVLVISAISAVPGMTRSAVGAVLALGATIGFAYTIVITIRILGPGWEHPVHWSDKHYYGIVPALAYLGLAAAAAAVWLAPAAAAYAVGAAVLVLLLVAIRNAWDLAITLAHRPRDPSK